MTGTTVPAYEARARRFPRGETVPTPLTDVALDDVDLADPATWGRDDVEGLLALRREHRPIARDAHRSTGQWFWSVTRWRDVAAITADPVTFTSTQGVAAPNDPGEPHPAEETMIVQDPPVHTATRKMVNRGFTPRQIRSLAPAVDRRVSAIVDTLRRRPTDDAGRAHADFVTEVATRLPAAVICDMMGIPETDQDRMVELTNRILTPNQYGLRRGDVPALVEEIDAYGLDLARSRLAEPGEDLTSLLVNGKIADEPLAPDQIGAFFRLLVLAGNETTRNGLSHGMLAVTEWPEERERWLGALGSEDEDAVAWSAAEEIVRWASPVIHMKRQVTRAVRVGDVDFSEGDKVVMWYPAVNRDPEHFADPYRFDILRDPNHQGGFGTGGPHFCLGANLARRELAITLTELLRAFPDIAVDGPVQRARSNFLNVITAMPVSYTP